MEPVWEYEWEFVQDGIWGGVKRTGFWMTDYEAGRWWAFGRPGTRRLDETKRDRIVREAELRASRDRGLEPWSGGGLPYDEHGLVTRSRRRA